jgi:hypothetical protein
VLTSALASMTCPLGHEETGRLQTFRVGNTAFLENHVNGTYVEVTIVGVEPSLGLIAVAFPHSHEKGSLHWSEGLVARRAFIAEGLTQADRYETA